MSAITSATTQSYSPLAQLKSELASEVSAGTISATDQSALSSALDDIDQAMQSSKPTAGSQPPSPDEMQSKISSLIDGEVSSGNLTSDQADELKNVFANTFKNGPQGAGGPGGPGGAGGPPPGPPPSDDSSSSSSSSSSSTSSDSDLAKLLSDFLQSLKDSNSTTSGYGSSGNTLSSQLQSLVVNFQA